VLLLHGFADRCIAGGRRSQPSPPRPAIARLRPASAAIRRARGRIPPTRRPIGRVAAEGTKDFVRAPYRLEVLPRGSHFVADQIPERVGELLLQHLAAHHA
jgi:hypothetical protein